MRFTRGDTFTFKFQRKNASGTVITELPDKMWFTVKETYYDDEVIIQKTLDDGIVVDNGNFYNITIESEDTRNLEYGGYVYDIQIKKDNVYKTITKGSLILDKEVTFDYE